MPLFRNILIREKVQIVHGHQSSSPLAHECILYARTMGYKACFTDHSLFGFADAARLSDDQIAKHIKTKQNNYIPITNKLVSI